MHDIQRMFPDCKPNDTQLFYSQFGMYSATDESDRPGRVLLYLGPGMGKSRIAATIGWLALYLGQVNSLSFVYPNSYLAQREKAQFSEMFKFLGFESKVAWTT